MARQGRLRVTLARDHPGSYGELDVFRRAEIRPLDFAAMGVRDYDIAHYQPLLFAAVSFDEFAERFSHFLASYDDRAFRRLAAAA